LALAQHGFKVKDMAKEASKVHKKELTKYGQYSRVLTGYQKPWIKPKNLKQTK
jgi:hypothetical protein